MTPPDPPPVTIVRPGEGPTGDLGAIGVRSKLWGRDTGGAHSGVPGGLGAIPRGRRPDCKELR